MVRQDSASGILLSKLLKPDSTWAAGILFTQAAKTPAKVEFVSPYTNTRSGLFAALSCLLSENSSP